MSSYIQEEILLFFSAAALGVLLLFSYDLLRALRRAIPHAPMLLALEDLSYWIAAGLCCFAVVYRENQGNLRFFLLQGLLTGAAVYHRTLEPVILRGLTGFLRILTFYVKILINRLLFPVKRGRIYSYKFRILMKRGFQRPILKIKRGRPGAEIHGIIQDKKNRE
jgi:spore cortex biosynthesis protein YabQ